MSSSPLKKKFKFLVDNNYIEKKNVKWGKGHRDVYVINGKNYQYSGKGDINNTLQKIIQPLYDKANEYLNKKIHINDIVSPDNEKSNTKRNKEERLRQRLATIQTIQKQYRRRLNSKTVQINDVKVDFKRIGAHIYKEKFSEIVEQYNTSQENQTNPSIVEVVLITAVKHFELDPDDPQKMRKRHTHTSYERGYSPAATVYGGINGIKLYLQTVIIENIYHWEDSELEV